MRLFVTGASGYLGGAVAKALLPHHELRLLVRDPKRFGDDLRGTRGVEIVEGDLLDSAKWESKLDGCDGVLHLAALVTQWAPFKQFRAVNLFAFRNLLVQCWKRRIERFIYTSSLFALGPTEPSPDPSLWQDNPYVSSKREALTVARSYQKKGFPLTTLIPTILYGPGPRTEGNHLSTFLQELTEGRNPLLPDQGKWVWNFVYVEDAAEGCRLVLEKGKTGEEYILGGESVSLDQFFETAARLLGRKWTARPIPLWGLKGYAFFEELLASVSSHRPKLTRGALSAYRHDWDFRDDKAREELGYQTISLEEGLRRTLEWLRTPHCRVGNV